LVELILLLSISGKSGEQKKNCVREKDKEVKYRKK